MVTETPAVTQTGPPQRLASDGPLRIKIVERTGAAGGPGSFRLSAARGAEERRLRTLFGTLSLETTPLPAAEARWFCGDPDTPAVMAGTWQATAAGPGFLVATRSAQPNETATLDGRLRRSGRLPGMWELDAIYTSAGAGQLVLARLRQRLTEQAEPGAPSPAGEAVVIGGVEVPSPYTVTSPPPGRPGLVDPAAGQIGNPILESLGHEFDVVVRCAEGFDGNPSVPAVLTFSPQDIGYRNLSVSLNTVTDEVRAGFVSWEVRGVATAGHAAGNRLAITGDADPQDPSAPGGTLCWWTGTSQWTTATAVRFELDYDAATYRVTGELAATDTAGGTLRATLEGVLRSRDVEALRAQVSWPTLAGSWDGVLGPVQSLTLGGEPGEFATGDLPEPVEFLRLAVGPDLAIGLGRATAGQAAADTALVLLTRTHRTSSAMAAIGIEQRSELRTLGQSLTWAARYAEAVPVLRHAAELYVQASKRPGAWRVIARSDLVSALNLVVQQLTCAVALTDDELMLLSLTEGVGYQRRLRDLADAGEPQLVRGYGPALTGLLETWRTRLDDDSGRIGAVTAATGVFALLVSFLLEAGEASGALVASEAARARAFADLLYNAGPRTGRPLIAAPTPPVTGTRLRAIMTEHGRTVVEYFIHPGQTAIWVATPDGTARSVPAAPRMEARLAEAAGRYRTLAQATTIDPADPAPMDEVLRELGELLWDPIPAAWLPGDPDQVITVVPHAATFGVPFPALRDADGRYLVERHPLTLVPALAVLPELTRRHRAAQGGPERLLALVDPWPLPGNPLDPREPFPRTAFARRLFDRVAGLYPASDVRSGLDASVSALLTVGRVIPELRPSVVHFGTHAVALENEQGDPLDSFVALARTDGGHDGKLRARDIFGKRIPGDTVVLSACATGRGQVTGDGVIGLSRAFLSAGPTTLLLTLCDVGEEASLELTYEFHRQRTRDRCTPALALARAQRAAIAAAAPPYTWSPFVLYGLG